MSFSWQEKILPPLPPCLASKSLVGDAGQPHSKADGLYHAEPWEPTSCCDSAARTKGDRGS